MVPFSHKTLPYFGGIPLLITYINCVTLIKTLLLHSQKK